MLLCKKQHGSFHNSCIGDKPASQADGDTTTDNKKCCCFCCALLLCTQNILHSVNNFL